MGGPAFVANAEDIALERLRVFARELAHMATDLTTLTFSVPVNHVAIQSHLTAMQESIKASRFLLI